MSEMGELLIEFTAATFDLPGCEIRANVTISRYLTQTDPDPKPPCEHCVNERTEEYEEWDKVRGKVRSWECRRMVKSRNEGGCASTWVCADCIVNALARCP